MRGLRQIADRFLRPDAVSHEAGAVDVVGVAGGTLVRGAAGEMSDLRTVLASLPRLVSEDAPVLLLLAPKVSLSSTSRRLLDSDEETTRRVVVFENHPDGETHAGYASTFDRFELRSIINRYWTESAAPLLAVVGKVGFELAWAIDEALGTDMTPSAAGTPRRAMKVESRDAVFDLISGAGASVRAAGRPRRDLIVPSTVAGMGVIHVGEGAFAGADLLGVSFGAPLRSIGKRAFAGCEQLVEICLPGSLDLIGEEAFAGCKALRRLRLPRGVRTIGRDAFRACRSLESVSIPSSVVTINESAFDGCGESLRFQVESGSFGHDWVTARGLAHELVAPEPPRARSGHIDPVWQQGVRFQQLPGAAWEVIEVESGATVGRVISEKIAGLPVRGFGYGAVPDGTRLDELRLPDSLLWVAPYAVGTHASVGAIVGAPALQARGRHSLPENSAVRVRAALDADSVRLTLRMVCARIGVDVPWHLEDQADVPFPNLSAGVLSSNAGSLFFGTFAGERIANLEALRARGVTMFISDAEVRDESGVVLPHVIHPAPWRAFSSLCAWFAEQYDARTIAVTGSVGKTSTKEMLQRVCSTDRNTLYSTGNQNGIAQVGRYLQKLTTRTEVYIQETGAARTGSVEAAAEMLHPDAFLITNIGVNHIGNYGGVQDNILKDKASHDKYLPADGVAFLNFDDLRLRDLTLEHRVISYAIDATDADYFAEDVVEAEGQLSFTMVEAATDVRVPATVHGFGRHNVSNAVVAFAVGRWLGIDVEKIAKGISEYRGEGLRENLVVLGGRRALLDCYNASEIAVGSTADALQHVSVARGGRRVLVFADIDDKLGGITEEVHRRVGRRLVGEQGIDRFVLFGDHAAWTAEELRAGGRDVFHTSDREALHQHLRETLTDDDVPAFKGGQQMALSITIDALYGSAFILLDGDVLARRGTNHVSDGLRFREIREYGGEVRGFSGDTQLDVRIPGTVDGVPVYLVGKNAFRRSSVARVTIDAPIRTIGPSAFMESRELQRIDLPASLRFIGRSAFNGCSSLREVDVPAGVTTISARAFYRCGNLQRLSIPASVLTIEKQVFSYSRSVVIECPAGSYADHFVRENWPHLAIRHV